MPYPAWKKDLIDELALILELDEGTIEKAIHAVGHSMREAIIRGEKVVIPGFGTFTPHVRVYTRERYLVGPMIVKKNLPPKQTVKFTPSRLLIDYINDPTVIPPKKTLC